MPDILFVCSSVEFLPLKTELEASGWGVRLQEQFDGLLEAAKIRPPQFLILDFDLTETPPWDVLTALRLDPETRRLPFLILSARHTSAKTMVTALRLGAVEYLIKPVDPKVLVARVSALAAVLERRRKSLPSQTLRSRDNRLTLDSKAHRCLLGEGDKSREIKLTPKEFLILACLMGRPDALVTKEELLRLLWPSSVHSSEENANTLAQHIAHLRRKLGPSGKCLNTVWGIGYRFAS